MSISFSQTTDVTCPQCSHAFPFEVWLIVAATERSDLIERIRAGTLHQLTCPQCGQTFGELDAPLLIFRPDAEPPILFSPAQQTTNEQDQQLAAGLIGLLRERLGEAWQDAWLAEGLQGVQREMLPVMLADDPEAAQQEIQAHVQAELDNLRERGPEAFAELEAQVRQALEEETDTTDTSEPIVTTAVPQIAQTLDTFIKARTWSESYRQVQADPELLSDTALVLIEQGIMAAQAAGNTNAVTIFTEHRDLLRRCNEIGVDAAFAEKMGVGVSTPPVFAPYFTEAQQAARSFLQSGNRAALDRAAVAWHTILEHPDFAAAQPDFRLTVLNNAGGTFLRRYWAQGCIEDLNRALDLWTEAVQTTPPDSPVLPSILTNLGIGLRDRYARTGRLEDLEQALTVFQQAVQTTPPDSRALPSRLTNLGIGLSDRYARTGRLEDLEQALAVFQQAVQTTPPESPALPSILNNLGSGLSDRYARTGRLEDLEQALTVFQQAVQTTPPNSPALPGYLSNLGIGLRDRYARTGRLEDLEQALAVFQQAVQTTPPESPALPSRLTNLGIGLRNRYARTGRLEDLEQALAVFQQAVQTTPPNSPALPGYLSNLGTGLRDRYARTGRLEDLEQALAVFQQAVQTTPPDSPDLPSRLTNLGNGLRNRYVRTDRLEDLEQALAVYEQAVQTTPPDSPALPGYLSNLGNGLHNRYARTDRLEDLEQALAVFQQAVQTIPPDSPDLPGYLSNLGIGLRDRYARTGHLEDLEQALAVFQQAVQTTPPDSPALPGYLNNLGTGLRSRYAWTGRLEDLEQAQQYYAIACDRGQLLAPEVALTTAQTWGPWASERKTWDEAIQAFDAGIATIEQLHRTQLRRSESEVWLSGARGLHMRAAYALMQAGTPVAHRRAVEVAELGRARGLGEILARDRSDLSDIEQAHPETYERYWAAAEQVRLYEHSDRTATQRTEPSVITHTPDLAARILAAREQLDTAVDAIRALPSYAGFLRPPTFAEIAASARPETPLVYLVVTPQGSAALIVPLGADEPEALPLDSFIEEALNALLIIREGDQVVGGYLPGQLGTHQMLNTALTTTLPLLGEQLIGPIATRLRTLGARGVTLIPTGLLSLLPLHAATYVVEGQTRCLLDEFDVAYAPSARVLATAQREANQRQGALHLAGVGNPTRDLRYAGPELASVCELLPAGTTTAFYEAQARREALWHVLPEATIAHFSCHGSFADDPLDAALYLADDDRITLRDLVTGDTPALANLQLVVLSACQTALTDFRRVPDESIGLPGGFLQAGVPAVVGTLWSVDDLSTALLMHRFYELYLQGDSAAGRGPQPPARALRLAQLWLRDITFAELQAYLEYHEVLKVAGEAASRLPWVLIEEGLLKTEQVQEQQRTERPFAEPRYWAPFTFSGAMEAADGR